MPIRFQRDAIDDKRRYCVKREKNKEERLKIPIISKSSRLEKKKKKEKNLNINRKVIINYRSYLFFFLYNNFFSNLYLLFE